MKIIIGKYPFTVTLYDNATSVALKSLLPLTVEMTELNGNRKYADLSASLPEDSSVPELIHAGDVMLFGTSTLVLFYKTFSTTYSYTQIGRIHEIADLADAVGSGDIIASYEL
ncbi:MAG: cyclophilin-like fold protein [Chitinophagaceae bacterium]